MKRIPSFLIALALGFTTLSTQAGLITDPLSVSAPQSHISAPSAAPVNVAAASTFLADVLGSLPADGTLRLSDLFMNPEFFAAAHAPGPQADALRGQIDWLMLTGVILGFDGMDGSDDLRGSDDPDEIFGESSNGIILGGPGSDNIILGGPGSDNLLPMIHLAPLTPFNPSVILGGPGSDNIILGGPGSDNLLPKTTSAPLTPYNPSIILGGPGSDNIILGGPGSDNLSSDSAEHNPN